MNSWFYAYQYLYQFVESKDIEYSQFVVLCIRLTNPLQLLGCQIHSDRLTGFLDLRWHELSLYSSLFVVGLVGRASALGCPGRVEPWLLLSGCRFIVWIGIDKVHLLALVAFYNVFW